jgi:hypothetical protein
MFRSRTFWGLDLSFSWQGASGRWYEFEVARAKRDWHVFVKPAESPAMDAGGPVALYVAKTNDFSGALARHDMWAAAQQLGAAEIHLLQVADDQSRMIVEKDLIDAQRPILNRQMLRRVA